MTIRIVESADDGRIKLFVDDVLCVIVGADEADTVASLVRGLLRRLMYMSLHDARFGPVPLDITDGVKDGES